MLKELSPLLSFSKHDEGAVSEVLGIDSVGQDLIRLWLVFLHH